MRRDLALLERLVLEAHARDDRPALIAHYAEAGDLLEAAGDIDRACFARTHAYVLALEAGDRVRAAALHGALVARGREM